MNMMGRIAPAPPAAEAPAAPAGPLGWRAALAVLGVGLLAWGLRFAPEITAAVRTWNSSTAYNHCWLIGPIAAWLFWQRRHRLQGLAPAPNAAFALLAVPGAVAWLLAERLGVMEGRQLVAFGLAQVLVLAVLGWPFVRAFIGPLAYLVFLVPFGGFAVGPLQHITARLIDWGLDLVGITHFVDGLLIETPAGLFHVAEACAGLRFIIAALAFGALYALVIFRSPWRRLVVMGLALGVPIIANGIRAGGIIVVAEYLGSAEAAAADHIIYGWGFFSVVILLLVLAGLPFREDSAPPAPRAPDRAPPGPAATGRLVVAGAAALALLATGPAVAAGLARGTTTPTEHTARLEPSGSCSLAADGTGLDCQGLRVSARVLEFSPRVNWSAVSAARWRYAGGSDTEVTFAVPKAEGGAWRARLLGDQPGGVVVGAWLGGLPANVGLSSRLRQGRHSLLGGDGAPVLVVVSLRADPAAGLGPNVQRDRLLLEAVLEAQSRGLAAQAAALSRPR